MIIFFISQGCPPLKYIDSFTCVSIATDFSLEPFIYNEYPTYALYGTYIPSTFSVGLICIFYMWSNNSVFSSEHSDSSLSSCDMIDNSLLHGSFISDDNIILIYNYNCENYMLMLFSLMIWARDN